MKKETLKKITSSEQLGIGIVLVILLIIIGSVNSNFFSAENIMNVLRSTSYVFIIGIAKTFVLITGGLDLSVGAVNGILVVKARIPALIVTLGMMYVCEGLALIITQGTPIYPLPDGLKKIGQGSVLSIPNAVIISLVLAVIGAFVLRKTPYGRSVYAVGGNFETARVSGIDVNKVQISVYILVGVAAALAGILMAGRLSSAQPGAGSGYELKVVAAVVIGGTSMFGGSGKISGTFLGALLMVVIENGMLLMRISAYWQSLVVGVIMVLAVGLDQYRRKRLGLSR